MVTLKTPDAAATKSQLWLLHLLTKQDTRNLNLTMQEASNRIEELKSNGKGKPQGDTARVDYRVSGIKDNMQTKSTPLFTTADAERIANNGNKMRPEKWHYCVMFSVAPSTHRMSNGKRKWKSCYNSKNRGKAIKEYNRRLAYINHNPSLYPTEQVVIVECLDVIFARNMLLAGKTEYTGKDSGKLYARIIKDSRA